jgi:hypothetical protein
MQMGAPKEFHRHWRNFTHEIKRCKTPRPCVIYSAATMIVMLIVLLSTGISKRLPSRMNFARSFFSLENDVTFFTLISKLDLNLLVENPEKYNAHVNAINSWLELVPPENVLIFAKEKSSCDYVDQQFNGVRCLLQSSCIEQKYELSMINCVWDRAILESKTQFMNFLHPEIVIMRDFLDTFSHVTQNMDEFFVMVGERKDIALHDVIDFRNGDELKQLDKISEDAEYYQERFAVDYFIFPTDIFVKTGIVFPSFIAEMPRWQNWLLSEFILSERVVVIDATTSITALRLETVKLLYKWDRSATAYNEDLVKQSGMRYRIGNVFFADKILHGKCSVGNCKISPNDARDLSLIAMFLRMSSDMNLALITVNFGYLDLAKNWLCHVQKFGFQNFIFLAEDISSYDELSKLGASVIISHDAPLKKAGSEYGSKEFQETMTFRTNFIFKALYYGINVLTSDADSIWTDDPFKYADKDADLQGQQHKLEKLSGGLIYIKSTDRGKAFWKQILACQEENMKFINSHKIGTYEPSKYTEQACINDISALLKTQGKMKVFLWKNNLFPDGKAFFENQLPHKQGVWPVIIHNNWIVGIDKKIQRFKDWGLWGLDQDSKCINTVSYEAPSIDKIAFTIKVLAFDRPASLSRLLRSLEDSDYVSDKISLIVSIDHPSESSTSDVLENRKETLKAANDFSWSHGPYKVEDVEIPNGLVKQWVNSWKPKSDSEVIAIFEDDIEVSPLWYRWAKKSIETYYYDSDQYDPRLFGISLQLQHTILGENVYHSYGQGTPADFLPENAILYKYQLIGTWGSIFFPRQWNEFLSWFEEKKSDYLPCVPNLLSNEWFMKRPGQVWSQYYVRFAFEKGYYMLYSNFKNRTALITNHREAGINFHETKGASNDLIQEMSLSNLQFPASSDIPIYDFNFNEVPSGEVLSFREKLFPDPEQLEKVDSAFLSNPCVIFKQYKKTESESKQIHGK